MDLFLYSPQQNMATEADHCLTGLDDDIPIDIDNENIYITNGNMELTNLADLDIEDYLNTSYSNNNNTVVVKQEMPVSENQYTAIKIEGSNDINRSPMIIYSNFAPSSPSGSWISTDDFPEELGDISNVESEMDSIEEITTITVPVINIDLVTEEEGEESISSHTNDNHLREPTRQGGRRKRYNRMPSPVDSTDSDGSDTDYVPEEEEEYEPTPQKRTRKGTRPIKREPTSDYESEDFEPELGRKTQKRQPSKNPEPQRRKAGRKQKISQWIVSLLRNPQHNPSVITWQDEIKGKFQITDSNAYADLWGKVKGNPNMNYEKLSRAMRYYYKNKEIKMVEGERLTYAFGPRMEDFHALNRADPNFSKTHKML